MAINQRSLGSDLKTRTLDFFFETHIGHGHSGMIYLVPFSCQINAIQMTSTYQANSPYLLLSIQRFIPGYGLTTILFGSTFTIPVYGTSGIGASGVPLPTDTNLLKLMANDAIWYYCHSQSASGIIESFIGSIVVTPTQDRITYFGNQTEVST